MRFKIFTFIGFLALFNCDNNEKRTFTKVSTGANTAESVYLTRDETNRPVVVWTEKSDNKLTLLFAISDDNGKSFMNRRSKTLTADVATDPERMPKVAFKNDGTIVAAFEKKAPTAENKYAGAIYYVVSKDGGKSWTDEMFLHSDTISGRSRSYFDIESLPDGEIGAAWLDIKVKNETGGRTVRFTKTSKGKGFGNELLVDSSACQCCRIDVYGDITGRVNIAYRGIEKGMMGQSIRDMMLAVSDDGGDTFSAPSKISADNWSIDGCPHTGPSLCSNKGGLYSFWYTEGNGTGLYYTFKQNTGATFGERQLISNSGRHPQMSANNTRLLMVWEENVGEGQKFTNIHYKMSDDVTEKRSRLTPAHLNAFVPVVTTTTDGFLVAFLMETEEGVGIYTAKLQ